MERIKLNIRYHNPNSDEDLIRYITPIFVEACKVKLDSILLESSGNQKESPSE